MYEMNNHNNHAGLEIAVIGMACLFPGAKNIDEFWDNLKKGVESITFFTDEELEQAGIDKDQLKNPNYVKAMGFLSGVEEFDAHFFDYSPAEAEVMEPQVRLFHECAWEALEDAAYPPGAYDGLIGLFAGAADDFYWKNLAVLSGKMEQFGRVDLEILANRDFLCGRLAYKFNLKGPVVFVHTACSTSLVAIHMACQGLLSGETDIALAGGVSIIQNKGGYIYQEGMILSADGHCRPFDDSAGGTLGGNGVGIVVLKRLEEAIEEGDHIYAIIKGSAINNDGTQKMGWTAPSVEGQCEAIKDALQNAQVEAESIGYVEAHGTGTALGDPVEIEALTLAFNTDKKGFCGIGSVKSNLGHLNTAAGVAGFIKTVLSLKYKVIPPGLHFDIPNRNINLINSPFYINTDLREWKNETEAYSRRAGVSSLGIGGTNAHVILEEWSDAHGVEPTAQGTRSQGRGAVSPPSTSREYQLILLSAKTKSALDQSKKKLAKYLNNNPTINLTNAAYTLQVGRKSFKHRWMAVCTEVDEAIDALITPDSGESHILLPEEENTINNNIITKPEPVGKNRKLLLTEIGHSWLHGEKINWHQLYSENSPKPYRISLPTYPFERQRYWLEKDSLQLSSEKFLKKSQIEKETNIARWFYIPSWRRSSFISPRIAEYLKSTCNCWMVFVDELEIGFQVVNRLREKKHEVIVVILGTGFTKVDEHQRTYIINPYQSSDYDALFKELTSIGKIPGQILHFWSLYREYRGELVGCDKQGQFEAVQYRGLYSLLFLAKAINKLKLREEVHISVVTANTQNVTGNDLLCPEMATVMGAVRVIPQEFPYIICRNIDIELSTHIDHQHQQQPEAKLAEQLICECYSSFIDPVVAYRGCFRWVQTFESLPLETARNPASRFKKKGIYLVTHGFGNIGLTLAQYLVRKYQAKIVLVGCSPLPEKEQWEKYLPPPDNHPLYIKNFKIQHLEQLGGEVLAISADLNNLEQMEKAVIQAEKHFGRINGVFHTGVEVEDSTLCTIENLDREKIQKQFQSSVYGLMVLEKILKDREKNLDFCLVVSSLVSVLGGLGFAAYAAAIIFRDAFVHFHNRNHYLPWISVNTTEWLFEKVTNQNFFRAAETIRLRMTVEEGLETFERILSLCSESQVIISTGNLDGRINKWVKLETLRSKESSNKDISLSSHPRPELSSTYVPPASLVETTMARVWQKFFNIQPIGIQDNFFELGGDSLKAITLLSRIHKEFAIKISIEEFFKNPVIKSLSRCIAKGSTRDEDRYMSIESSEEKEYYALSSAQKRLYILQQMDLKSTAYNLPDVLYLLGETDVEKLKNTFKKLIQRHETLRTSFKMIAGEPVQRIYGEVELVVGHWALVTGKGNDGLEIESIIKDFVHPFDLALAPLMRVGLIKEEENKHILMVDMHHIISDGVSQGILIKDLMALYSQQELPPLKIQYKDFTGWQQGKEVREIINHQEKYWLDQFKGEITTLDLPTDYTRPVIQGFKGSVIHVEIDKDDADALKVYALKARTTLFTVLLAIYNLFLSKISGQEDIVVGTPIAGRRHSDLEDILGMFVNTLAIRNFPIGEKDFNQFLEEMKTRTMEAFENQDYPYEELVEKIVVNRDVGRNPLFDTMFILQNMDIPEIKIPGLELKPYNFQQNTSKFDMTLQCIEIVGALRCTFEYSTKLFKPDTIERFNNYFKKVISIVIKNPAIKLANIEIITEEEKKQVLDDFNDTLAEYPEDKTLHQLFAEQVERTPDNTALLGGNPKHSEGTGELAPLYISYRELNEKSDQLTHSLIEKGVKPDAMVGIMVERSLGMIIGILGILKAGGAYLPIDPDYPQERIDFMLKDSHVGVLLTTPKLQVKVKAEVEENFDQPRALPLQFINIETGLESNFEPSPSTLTSTCQVSPTNLAYIIYTSGSTGKAKGVMVEHRSVVNILSALFNIYPLKESRCCLLKTSFTFDVSVSELFGWFKGGGCLVIPGKDDHKNPEKIMDIIEHSQITHINFVPSMFGVFIDQLNHQNKGKLTSLKYIFLAGETLPPKQVTKFRELNTGIVLENLYGPTEGTIYVSRYSLSHWNGTGNIPIGKPLQNTKLYILNNNFCLVPVGVSGELCIAGVGLSRGYLNNPELTFERFVNNKLQITKYKQIPNYKMQITNKEAPFGRILNVSGKATTHHSPIYRTGDLARWLGDGNIEFLGRIDHQVKIRGFRIELGEIESQLLDYDGIKEAVVVQGADEKEDNYLCAYIVSNKKRPALELREFLSGKLPDYMVPAYFLFLDRFSLTPNGKVDRKSLPKPGIEMGQPYIAPGNKIEKKLVAIWSELLSLDKEKISIDANFFQLGGHSLKAAVMTAKVQKELHVKLPMTEIFKNPNIKSLSRYIKDREKKEYKPIEPIEKKEYYFLSPAQKRLYIQQQMDFQSTAYNMPRFIFLSREIQGEKLREIFKRLIKRHESLRTSFQMKDDKPVQRIHDHVEFEMEYYQVEVKVKVEEEEEFFGRISNACGEDLATEDTENTGEKNYKLQNTNYKQIPNRKLQITNKKEAGTHHSSFIIHHSFVRPLDLSRAPLLRVGLVKPLHTPAALRGHPSQEGIEDKYLLLVDMHHIISDGISHEILESEFMQMYKGQELPGLRLQYKDFSQWRNHQANSLYMKNQEDYWLKQFNGSIPALNLPTDYPRGEVKYFKGSTINFEISAEAAAQLRKIIADEGTTSFITIFAVFNVFLAKLSGQEDIIVGTPIAGRNHADLEPIIGMFVNTLAMRNYPQQEKTFLQFLREVKNRVWEAFENQDYPLEELVEKAVKKREPGRSPLFDVMFQLRTLDLENEGEPGHEISAVKPVLSEDEPDELININRTSKYDLTFDGVQVGKQLSFSVEYSTRLFKKETIAGYVDYFQQIITEVLKKPDIPLKEIKLSHEFHGRPLDNPEINFDF